MSIQALNEVINHSPYPAGTLYCVQLMVANVTNDEDGNELWMTQAALATRAHTSVASVKRALAQLVADGYLEPLEQRPARGAGVRYRVRWKLAQIELPPIGEVAHLVAKGSSSEDPVLLSTQKKAKAAERGFAEVWAAYPRHKNANRKLALGKYLATLKRCADTTQADLLAATERYARERGREDWTFTKHAETFFGPAEWWRGYLSDDAPVDPDEVDERALALGFQP